MKKSDRFKKNLLNLQKNSAKIWLLIILVLFFAVKSA